MKREQKSLTNKGFSLVELIIVVAIMAVLIGVLAPQYLRYVEKSRLQKDNTSIAEVANVIKMASAEEKVVNDVRSAASTVTYKFDSTGLVASGCAALDDEVNATITAADVKLSSTTYTKGVAAGTPYLELTVEIDSNSIMTVKTTGWKDTPGGSATTKTF